MLSNMKTHSSGLLCPEAPEAVQFNSSGTGNGGFGTLSNAWSGAFQANATPVLYSQPPKFINNTAIGKAGGYRTGTYGYNRFASAIRTDRDSSGQHPTASELRDYFGTTIQSMRGTSDVPVFFDSVWVDVIVSNGTATSPVQNPPDLTGVPSYTSGSPQHWRFMLRRHGRAINVSMADGSAKRVLLEDLYQLKWAKNWQPYTFKNLPKS
jgi:prepilin-type processing-associated H-X9-DG protein